MISEKYLAGFLDSDGSIAIQMFDNRIRLNLRFSQKTSHDMVLSLIQKDYGGTLHVHKVNGVEYSTLSIPHNETVKILNRIKQHLVIKRDYADHCLDAALATYSSKEAVWEARDKLKTLRKVKTSPVKNFPSRKWLAGYIDGDGCFSHGTISPSGNMSPHLHIACANFDTEGITLIQKVFGGRQHDMAKGTCKQYILPLNPSKAVQFLEYFSDYLITKKDQAKLILKCAKEMQHYRDGRNIKIALQALKAHPHRLNEKAPNLEDHYKTIQNLAPNKQDYSLYTRDSNGKINGKRCDSRTILRD